MGDMTVPTNDRSLNKNVLGDENFILGKSNFCLEPGKKYCFKNNFS